MRRRFPYAQFIVSVLLIAASVALFNVTGRYPNGTSLWETWFAKFASPVYRLSASLTSKYRNISVAFMEKSELERELEQLQNEVGSLNALKSKITELESENLRLKDLLGFRDTTPGTHRAAKVLGRNLNKWFSTLTISLGSKDGVQVDDPVISRNGLVGRILSCDEATAVVLLLTDPESGVGAIVEGSRDYGALVGGGGPDKLLLRLFSKDAEVKPGDTVVTSGLGSKFPAGILVGKVVSVQIPKPGLVKEAVLAPASDFNHLEEVVVIGR